VPLPKLTPDWIHGRLFLSYVVGAVLVAAGIGLLLWVSLRRPQAAAQSAIAAP
jgi:hypothetical protein